MWKLLRWCAGSYIIVVGSLEQWSPNPYAIGMLAVIVVFSISQIELLLHTIAVDLRKCFRHH